MSAHRLRRNDANLGRLLIAVDDSERARTLAGLAKRHGFEPCPLPGPPSIGDLRSAAGLLVDADTFEKLPLQELADIDIPIWLDTSDDPISSPLLPRQRVAKRALDLIIAGAALVVTGPALLLIAASIKLTSRGPALHTQTRVGLDGRRFTLHKFRTMTISNDAQRHLEYFQALASGHAQADGGVYKITDDSRVTPLGRTLRRYSLDELPQLFNVMSGAMSVVGPRPILPRELVVMTGRSWSRHRVKPGITGLWQVSGRSTTTFETMIELDQRYWRDWSVLGDLRVIVNTPAAMLRAETA